MIKTNKKMELQTLDSPNKLATYLTDIPILQRFFEQYVTLKTIEEKKQREAIFWANVKTLPIKEQTEIKNAHAKCLQRLLDRTGSIIHFLKVELSSQTVLS
jgi:hypothetical protein